MLTLKELSGRPGDNYHILYGCGTLYKYVCLVIRINWVAVSRTHRWGVKKTNHGKYEVSGPCNLLFC